MKKNDIDGMTRELLKDTDEAAAIINLALFNGRQVIRAGNLSPMDTTSYIERLSNGANAGFMRRCRDLLYKSVVQVDGDRKYFLVGIENQTRSDSFMPLRVLTYDILQYNDQIHEKGRGLLPVVTIVVHYGPDPWKGPLSFRKLFPEDYSNIMEYIPEYSLNLVSAHNCSTAQLDTLGQKMRSVLYYMQNAFDFEKMNAMLQAHPELKTLPLETGRLIAALADIDVSIEETEGEIDMCKAMRELKEMGRKEGREEGRQEGRQEGREEGRMEERKENCMTVIQSLWARKCSCQFIIDTISEAFSLSPEEANRMVAGAIPELAH